MKTFTIVRSEWQRGAAVSLLKMLRTGKMCCLGQIACQLGYTPKEILGVAHPDGVEDRARLIKAGFVNHKGRNTHLANRMMTVNDDTAITDAKREAKLKKLAARRDYKLKFV